MFVAGSGLVTLRREDAVQQNISAGLDTIEKWKAASLKAEIDYLKDVATHIRASNNKNRNPKWMLVAATKVDLLFDDLQEVERYYSPHGDSDFAKILNDLVAALGTDNFEWDAVPVCSALDAFSWGSETLHSKLGEDARDHYLSKMVSRLGDMCR